LADLFGVPDAANPAPAIDPEQRQKRLHGVVKRGLHDPTYGGARVIPPAASRSCRRAFFRAASGSSKGCRS